MTEFEMATLAVQRMGVLVAAVVGFSQCALIGGGLFMMRRAAIMRDKALDELISSGRTNHEEVMNNHKQFMANHRETMAKHEKSMELQEKNHREAMAKQDKNHEQFMANHEKSMGMQEKNHREAMEKIDKSHEESMTALHELIRQTSKAEE